MKPPKNFTLALSLFLFLFATGSAFAKSKSHQSHQSHRRENRKEPSKTIDASDATIEKVDSGSITVKSREKTQTYGIDAHTEILVAHLRSSAGALQNGMIVSVHASTLNPTMAESINVDDPSARTPEPPKAAEPKQGKTRQRKKKK